MFRIPALSQAVVRQLVRRARGAEDLVAEEKGNLLRCVNSSIGLLVREPHATCQITVEAFLRKSPPRVTRKPQEAWRAEAAIGALLLGQVTYHPINLGDYCLRGRRS